MTAKGLEGHRKEFRFLSECNGKPLEGWEQRSNVVLFIPLKDTLLCGKQTILGEVEEAGRPVRRLLHSLGMTAA